MQHLTNDQEINRKEIERIIKNMYSNTMDEAYTMYKVAEEVAAERYNDGDYRWLFYTQITAVYKAGIERGIRQERAKKKAKKKATTQTTK